MLASNMVASIVPSRQLQHVWNSLPESVRALPSLPVFRSSFLDLTADLTIGPSTVH